MRRFAIVWGRIALGVVLLAGAGAIALSGIDLGSTPDNNTETANRMAARQVELQEGVGGPSGTLIIPVQGVPAAALVDTFTDARSEGRSHDAIDIMAPIGTPVVAAAAGRVEKLFRSDAGGTTVYVRSGSGRQIHYYAHLARYAPNLHEQQYVKQGQPIGEVGATGNADPQAPHLHFAVLGNAQGKPWWEVHDAINPYALLVRNSASKR